MLEGLWRSVKFPTSEDLAIVFGRTELISHNLESAYKLVTKTESTTQKKYLKNIIKLSNEKLLLEKKEQFLKKFAYDNNQPQGNLGEIIKLLESPLDEQRFWVNSMQLWTVKNTEKYTRISSHLKEIIEAKEKYYDCIFEIEEKDKIREEKRNFLEKTTNPQLRFAFFETRPGCLSMVTNPTSCIKEKIEQVVKKTIWKDPVFGNPERAEELFHMDSEVLAFWNQFIAKHHPVHKAIDDILASNQRLSKENNEAISFLTANSDTPIRRKSKDLLGRQQFAEKITDKIISWGKQEKPLTLGITGEWGSGKSSLVNLVIEDLKSRKINQARPTILHFNPWFYSGTKNLITEFFETLSKQLDFENVVYIEKQDKDIAKKLKSYARLFKTVSISGKEARSLGELAKEFAVISSISYLLFSRTTIGGTTLLYHGVISLVAALWFLSLLGHLLESLGSERELLADDKKTSLKQQKQNINAALMSRARPLMVVIDDIDRLKSEEVKTLFDLIKTNADFSHTIFLLCYDRTVVANTLSDESKSCSGDEYLKKIVNECYPLPQAKREEIIAEFSYRIFGAKQHGRDFPGLLERYYNDLEIKSFREQYADYMDSFAGMLTNLRQVKQLTKNLETLLETTTIEISSQNKKKPGINPIDFIGLEIIRLQCQKFYNEMLKNKDLFLIDDSFDKLVDKRNQAFLQIVKNHFIIENFHSEVADFVSKNSKEKHRKGLQKLLEALFPKIELAAQYHQKHKKSVEREMNDYYSKNCHPMNASDLRARYTAHFSDRMQSLCQSQIHRICQLSTHISNGKICTYEWFDSYFTLSPEKVTVALSIAEKESFLNAIPSKDAFNREINKVIKNKRIEALLLMLEDFSESSNARQHSSSFFSGLANLVEHCDFQKMEKTVKKGETGLCRIVELYAELLIKSNNTTKTPSKGRTAPSIWQKCCDLIKSVDNIILPLELVLHLYRLDKQHYNTHGVSCAIAVSENIIKNLTKHTRNNSEMAFSIRSFHDREELMSRFSYLLRETFVNNNISRFEILGEPFKELTNDPKTALEFIESFKFQTEDKYDYDWSILKHLPIMIFVTLFESEINEASQLDEGYKRKIAFFLKRCEEHKQNTLKEQAYLLLDTLKQSKEQTASNRVSNFAAEKTLIPVLKILKQSEFHQGVQKIQATLIKSLCVYIQENDVGVLRKTEIFGHLSKVLPITQKCIPVFNSLLNKRDRRDTRFFIGGLVDFLHFLSTDKMAFELIREDLFKSIGRNLTDCVIPFREIGEVELKLSKQHRVLSKVSHFIEKYGLESSNTFTQDSNKHRFQYKETTDLLYYEFLAQKTGCPEDSKTASFDLNGALRVFCEKNISTVRDSLESDLDANTKEKLEVLKDTIKVAYDLRPRLGSKGKPS